MNNQPPYWEICKLSPNNDIFKLMYQDWDNGFIQIGNISMYDKQVTLFPDLLHDILEDDSINRFLDSLNWNVSPINDAKEHQKLILEFHLANTNINADYIRVYYIDKNKEFQHETWEIYRYDNHVEIVNPFAQSSGEIKRFHIKDYSPLEMTNWLISDIESICGKKYCIWIDFGNR